MKNKYLIGIICYSSWCGLGFIRGVNSYKYSHNKYNKKESYMYLHLIANWFLDTVMYANPILLPVSIYKELYLLEVNIRNLESEKNSDFYNKLI